jgi:hypothetical protein
MRFILICIVLIGVLVSPVLAHTGVGPTNSFVSGIANPLYGADHILVMTAVGLWGVLAGEASAQCHDEEANSLALGLMHDMVTGKKTVQEARDYYAKEFLDYRRKLPTPYMKKLNFQPQSDCGDPDQRVLSP